MFARRALRTISLTPKDHRPPMLLTYLRAFKVTLLQRKEGNSMIRLIKITWLISTLLLALGGASSALAEEAAARGKLLHLLREEDRSLDSSGLGEDHPLRSELRKVIVSLESHENDDITLVLEEDESDTERLDPSKDRGGDALRVEVAPYAVLITLPDYQEANWNRRVDIEAFEILGNLFKDRKYQTLLFKDRAILAFCSQDDIYDFHVKFRGKFSYGLQSGQSRDILEIWKRLDKAGSPMNAEQE